ncbi:MAG: hypothetical protein ABIS50_24315 [Luteolibacter sp.]|uniref:hypothetical protein n=1 Tax=Luteolibacter sp. TaxID=1962973 RepID=UPI003266AE73
MPVVSADSPPSRFYWTLNRMGSFGTPEQMEKWGLGPERVKAPHEGLTSGPPHPTAKELMRELRQKGWSPKRFSDGSGNTLARVEVSPTGFNVVNFPSYSAACADDSRRAAVAKVAKAAAPACGEYEYTKPTTSLRELAAMVVLGAELQNPKFRESTGISDAVAAKPAKVLEFVLMRLAYWGGEEPKALWWALKVPKISLLTKADRGRFTERVVRIALMDGDTLESFLAAYAKVYQTSRAGSSEPSATLPAFHPSRRPRKRSTAAA